MMDLLRILWVMLIDQRGNELDPGEGQDPNADNDDPPADGGNKDVDPNADPEAEGKEGEEGEPEAAADGGDNGDGNPEPPAWKEYGDDPAEAALAILEEHNGLKGKQTMTEKNLSAIRKSLDGAGIRILQDTEGNISYQEKERPAEPGDRKMRFTAEHREALGLDADGKMEAAMRAIIQDEVETGVLNFKGEIRESAQQGVTRANAQAKMFKLYPGLKKLGADGQPNPEFNQAFWDKATEVYVTEYKGNPKGELLAAGEVAGDMGISPASISAARKAGYDQGKGAKKILGPAGGGKGSRAKNVASGGKLSREEYAKLDPTKKEAYDKNQLGVK